MFFSFFVSFCPSSVSLCSLLSEREREKQNRWEMTAVLVRSHSRNFRRAIFDLSATWSRARALELTGQRVQPSDIARKRERERECDGGGEGGNGNRLLSSESKPGRRNRRVYTLLWNYIPSLVQPRHRDAVVVVVVVVDGNKFAHSRPCST